MSFAFNLSHATIWDEFLCVGALIHAGDILTSSQSQPRQILRCDRAENRTGACTAELRRSTAGCSSSKNIFMAQ